MAEQPNSQQQSGIPREAPQVDQGRLELVKGIVESVNEAKQHWSKRFEKMRWGQNIARGHQWVTQEGTPGAGEEYVANITLRHINQRVAAIYAKNPRASAKRRQRMDFKVWDGQPESLAQARDVMARATMPALPMMPGAPGAAMPPPALPPDPAQVAAAQEILAEIEQVRVRRIMIDRLAKTLEIIFHYSLDEPIPRFKQQAKQLVRRVLTTGVGYIRLGYQRIMGRPPELESKIKDASDKIAEIERLTAGLADKEIQEKSAEAEKLKAMLADLQKQPEIVLREGLIFDFPKSWQIIPDINCTQLKGFVGAEWVAHEFLYTPAQIEKIWKKDVRRDYRGYTPEGARGDKRKKKEKMACVWIVYNLMERMAYTVCDGYSDFLEEPGTPDVDLEQFHPLFTLTFNDVEDDENIFPPSDVELLFPMQNEYNRSREGWRQHRIANRPAWISGKGAFGEEDKEKMSSHGAHENLELNLKSNQKVADVLQAKPTQPVDASLYDVEPVFADTLRVSGDAEANLGGTSGATATESSIAENTRVSSITSNIDDLDEMFTDLARAAGQVLLVNMSRPTALHIAGDGAVWPELSRKQVAEEVQLEIKAGSSGRPNRALKVANLEKLAPHIMQSPGLNPNWWTKQLIQEVDDGIDIDEALIDGMPSITALNGLQKPQTGNAATEPTMQGGRGAANAPQPEGAAQAGQSFPAGQPQQSAVGPGGSPPPAG